MDLAVVALDRCFADHRPILLKIAKHDFGPTPFRFFNQWLEEDGFNTMIHEVWRSTHVLGSTSFVLKEKFKSIKKAIKLWREQVGDNYKVSVTAAKAEMCKWDALAEQKQLSVDEAPLFHEVRVKYFKAEKDLSFLLKQKSRVK